MFNAVICTQRVRDICSNCAEAMTTRDCALPRASLVLAITNRATTLHSQNKMDKNSSRNSVRVLAWYLACSARKRINENLFEAFLYTECAYSECEPQGGENMSAELDG